MNHATLAAIVNEWVKEIGSNARYAAKEVGATEQELFDMRDDEQALRYLVDSLVGGATIPQFMIDEGLDWPAFSAWLMVEPKRYEAYQAALKNRSFIAKENLRDGWWRTAGIAVPEAAATHGDVHKAREALAKDLKMFDDKSDAKADVKITIVHESQ